MDEIFRMERLKRATEMHQMIEQWNPLIQNWRPSTGAANIPRRVQNALRLARRYRVELEALEPSDMTRREMPVWLHRKTSKVATRIYKTDGAKCLRNRHRTHYMGQLAELIESVPAEH